MDIIIPIQRKTYALLGDDPFYEITDNGCMYFTNVNGEWIGNTVSNDSDHQYISAIPS